MLPIALDGPGKSAGRLFRCPRVGPEIMLRVASDALEWARKVSWETLPMSLGGPRNNAEKCFRLHWMGPESQLGDFSDVLRWAQR
jgi:hypothetical protein